MVFWHLTYMWNAKFMSTPLTYGHSGWLMLQHRALGIFLLATKPWQLWEACFRKDVLLKETSAFFLNWIVEFQRYAKVAGLYTIQRFFKDNKLVMSVNKGMHVCFSEFLVAKSKWTRLKRCDILSCRSCGVAWVVIRLRNRPLSLFPSISNWAMKKPWQF